MKCLINIIFVLVVSVFLANVCIAGDVEDIKKATKEHFTAQNAGDAKAHMALTCLILARLPLTGVF